MQMAILSSQFDRDFASAGVTDNVGKGFLRDAETFGLDNRIDAFFKRVRAKTRLQTGERSLTVCVPAQSRFQAEVVQHRGTQIQREIVDLFEDASDCLDAFFEATSEGSLAGVLECGMEIQFGDGQGLADFIVQFARNMPALALLNFNETMGKSLKFMAGAVAFQFPLFESLGHQVKGESQAAQFIAAMAQAGSGREIAHGQSGAGKNQ